MRVIETISYWGNYTWQKPFNPPPAVRVIETFGAYAAGVILL
ncbi:hypothetical protein FDUTEX481_03015 [Tolypothrix sp. PCC 7601]|nr:hypothetical protein FDUTEX481_03015 [Tolypothrix sp. PCC 7601]